MKGNPLLRLAVALLLLAAVFWPVHRITSRSEPAPIASSLGNTESKSQATGLKATLSVQTAPPPSSLTVHQGKRVLLTDKEVVSQGKYRSEAKMTPGEDLVIVARWEDGKPHALHLAVRFEKNLPLLEKTFWAQEKLEDALALPQFSGQ